MAGVAVTFQVLEVLEFKGRMQDSRSNGKKTRHYGKEVAQSPSFMTKCGEFRYLGLTWSLGSGICRQICSASIDHGFVYIVQIDGLDNSTSPHSKLVYLGIVQLVVHHVNHPTPHTQSHLPYQRK